jgi:hypothetical protein
MEWLEENYKKFVKEIRFFKNENKKNKKVSYF